MDKHIVRGTIFHTQFLVSDMLNDSFHRPFGSAHEAKLLIKYR